MKVHLSALIGIILILAASGCTQTGQIIDEPQNKLTQICEPNTVRCIDDYNFKKCNANGTRWYNGGCDFGCKSNACIEGENVETQSYKEPYKAESSSCNREAEAHIETDRAMAYCRRNPYGTFRGSVCGVPINVVC